MPTPTIPSAMPADPVALPVASPLDRLQAWHNDPNSPPLDTGMPWLNSWLEGNRRASFGLPPAPSQVWTRDPSLPPVVGGGPRQGSNTAIQTVPTPMRMAQQYPLQPIPTQPNTPMMSPVPLRTGMPAAGYWEGLPSTGAPPVFQDPAAGVLSGNPNAGALPFVMPQYRTSNGMPLRT
jgi:hypothetical protein